MGATRARQLTRQGSAGALLALASGVSYGTATVFARSLAGDGVPASTVISLRFGIGGLLLVAMVLATGRSLRPAPGELTAALTLGTLGYAIEASLFFAGLERGSAGGVTVVFYCYPALVVLAESVLHRRRPGRRVVVAMVVAGLGTATVVLAGGDVTMTPAGGAFAVAAAAAFTAYLVCSDRFFGRTDRMVAAAWVSVGAAVGVTVRGMALGGLEVPTGAWLRVAGAGTASAFAFGLLFAALGRIGASRTAIVLNVEAVAAIVLGALFLHEHLVPVQLLGAAAVIGVAIWVMVPGQATSNQTVVTSPARSTPQAVLSASRMTSRSSSSASAAADRGV